MLPSSGLSADPLPCGSLGLVSYPLVWGSPVLGTENWLRMTLSGPTGRLKTILSAQDTFWEDLLLSSSPPFSAQPSNFLWHVLLPGSSSSSFFVWSFSLPFSFPSLLGLLLSSGSFISSSSCFFTLWLWHLPGSYSARSSDSSVRSCPCEYWLRFSLLLEVALSSWGVKVSTDPRIL